MRSLFVLRFLVVLIVSAPSGLRVFGADVPVVEPNVFEATARFARGSGWAWENLQVDLTSYPKTGDSVTFLLTLQEHRVWRQWLCRLTLDALKDGETALASPDTVYTSTGTVLHYPASASAVQVELAGPFVAENDLSPSENLPAAQTGRAVVNGEYLRQGIAPYCRSALEITQRMHAAGVSQLLFTGGNAPPTDAWKQQCRASVAKVGLTETEERLAFSVYFSLRTFFDSANRLPAVRNILESVVEKPSAWSIARNFGVNSNFNYGWQNVSAVPVALGDVPTYQLPVTVSLNGRRALEAWILVGDPAPPLEACAGIVGLRLSHPTDSERRLFIRALASARGKG